MKEKLENVISMIDEKMEDIRHLKVDVVSRKPNSEDYFGALSERTYEKFEKSISLLVKAILDDIRQEGTDIINSVSLEKQSNDRAEIRNS